MATPAKVVLAARRQEELIHAATALAEADLRMRRALVEARRAAGLSQQDVADALGIKQSSVAAFERYDNDPRQSTIRRYALVVGAQIAHDVKPFSAETPWQWVSGVTSGVTVSAAGRAIAAAAELQRLDVCLAA